MIVESLSALNFQFLPFKAFIIEKLFQRLENNEGRSSGIFFSLVYYETFAKLLEILFPNKRKNTRDF